MQSEQNFTLNTMQNQLKQIEKEINNIMNVIKQGVITDSTKSELLKLEKEKLVLETNIAKEQIKRPILSKEQIECWIYKFRDTDIANTEQKQRLIEIFINAIYVYDDKMLITFNYKDSEKCIDFRDIQKIANKKTSFDKQSSPLSNSGGPSRTRT